MMNKTMLVGLAVVGLLLLAILGQQQATNTAQTLPALPSFSAKDVQQVKIMQQDTVLLHAKRAAQAWLVFDDATQPVNQAAIAKLLADLQAMQVKRMVSSKAEHHARFDVAASAYQVMLLAEDGQPLLYLFVGKPATDLVSTYIRLAEQDVVLSVNQVLTWQVRRTAQTWLAVVPQEDTDE